MSKYEHTVASLAKGVAAGVAAGVAGTAGMFVFRSFDQKYAPRTMAMPREDPGQFIVQAIERSIGVRHDLPEAVEKSAATATHFGYGSTFGVVYSLWRGGTGKGAALQDGVLLGLVCYAVGYLGLLPLAGLTPPVWKQKYPQVMGELLRHVMFGIATTASFGAIGGRE